MKQKEKPVYDTWQTLRFMLQVAWAGHGQVLFFTMAIAGLEVGIKVAQLYIAPMILSKVEIRAPLTELVAVIAGLSGLLFLLTTLREYMCFNIDPALLDVRLVIFKKLLRKAYQTSYPQVYDSESKNKREKALTGTSDNHSPAENIWRTLRDLLKNSIGFFLYLLLLFQVKGFLVAVILVTTILSFFASRRIHEWGYQHREEEGEYRRRLWYLSMKSHSISIAKEIRLFGLGEWVSSIYEGVLGQWENFIARRERIYIRADIIDVLLSGVRNGIAYWYLIGLTLRHGFPASEFLLYALAISGFSAWVTGICNNLSTLHQESLEISSILEYLNQKEEFRFTGGEAIPQLEKGGWELRFKQVSFRYPGAESDTIHQMDLTIHPGEKLAVVGLNGAGKTTLVKLLCGFLDPSEGCVLLNGVDIRRFNRQEYYRLFSAVFQEISIPEIALSDIITQEGTDRDEKKLKDCMEMAGLSKTVEKLPNGVNTTIGRLIYEDGTMLSGGQMQRLLLARALYKDGPFLVLDEPTAALDPLAERDIYRKYKEMTAGKTSVFISHRLASTRFCDRILFLEKGKILEEGTHEELLKKGGAYAGLFEVQSRYYQEEGKERLA